MPVRLLPGERLEVELRPHPLSWMGGYLAMGFPAIWGFCLALIFRSHWWQKADQGPWYQFWTFLYGNTPMAFVYMFLGLAVVGAATAVFSIKWRRFFLYVGIGLLVAAATFLTTLSAIVEIPVMLVLASAPLLAWTEADRRSHRFTITNLRILFAGGTIIRKERQLKYESITDLDGSQGPLGRIFDYGTLIPVTQSGFGLGADTSQAQIMAGAGGGKGGIGGAVGVAAGGGKEVQVGRARTFHQLTGIRPYKDTKYLLERLILEATATPYLRQQVELQQKMLDALGAMRHPQDDIPVFEGKPVE